MSLTIFSFSNVKAIFELSFPIIDAYCKRHGYVFSPFHESRVPDNFKPHWNKLYILRDLLRSSESNYLVWFDHDIIIKETTQSLAGYLEKLSQTAIRHDD